MSGLELFQSGDWSVRSVSFDGEPWFVVADVCAALGLSNATLAANRLAPDDLSTAEVIDALGRTQRARITNEAGLYDLILDSRRPEAKAFRRWITAEVIPAIRQTGAYRQPALPQGDMLAHLELAVAGWRTEREGRELAEAKVAELEPVVHAIEQVIPQDGDYAVDEVAKLLEPYGVYLGPSKLWKLLREWNWVFGSPPKAYADLIREGALRHHPTKGYTDSLGVEHATWQVRVTGKGLLRIASKLSKAGAGPLAVVS